MMILSGSVSAKPLYDWFAQDRNHRAMLRKFYSDGRITNWKTRGIPRAEVGNVAQFMGLSYEQYIEVASVGKEWRQVAVLALLSAVLSFAPTDATSHNQDSSSLFFAKSFTGLHILVLWLMRWLCPKVDDFDASLTPRGVNEMPA